MARAVEIVEWMSAFAAARGRECRAAEATLPAEVFEEQARHYGTVAETLRGEMR
jgi:hypothetical protein